MLVQCKDDAVINVQNNIFIQYDDTKQLPSCSLNFILYGIMFNVKGQCSDDPLF